MGDRPKETIRALRFPFDKNGAKRLFAFANYFRDHIPDFVGSTVLLRLGNIKFKEAMIQRLKENFAQYLLLRKVMYDFVSGPVR